MAAPEQLVDLLRILQGWLHTSELPNALTEQLYDTRKALLNRDDSTLKSLCAGSTELWVTLAGVWEDHAVRLEEGDSSVLRSVTTLASLLVSLCSGDEVNQVQSVEYIEPHLRRILVSVSSFINLEDPAYTLTTMVCCQALANTIAGNDALASTYLPRFLESEASDKVVLRLMGSKDRKTLEAVLMFLRNSIYGSAERALLMGTSRAGSFIIDQVLILSASFFDAEDEARAQGSEEASSDVFSIAYSIVHQIIGLGAFPQTYSAQTSTSDFIVCDAQVTLLKYLDGYLSDPTHSTASSSSALSPFLLSTLSALVKDLHDVQRPKDGRDSATIQALVLVLNCISSLGLGSDEGKMALMTAIPHTIDLLRLSNTLIVPSMDGTTQTDPHAIAVIKRSCVQLLGILSFEIKEAQDEIRELGGLTLLLGLCQINDANPTLREHSLFAIRNILKNNDVNQELVSGMTPQYLVGSGGELRDLPPAMR